MNDEAVYRTAPATPGLLKIPDFWKIPQLNIVFSDDKIWGEPARPEMWTSNLHKLASGAHVQISHKLLIIGADFLVNRPGVAWAVLPTPL